VLTAEEANRRYFEAAYRTGQHGWEVETPSPYAMRFLKRLTCLVPGGKLLDIGCGEGRHAIAAGQMGFQVTAVDFEPRALQRARRFAGLQGMKGIKFRRADVFRLPFRDAAFDVALDYGCLHHQRKSDWPAYRASVLRVLKPQGFYVLSVFSPAFRFFRGSRQPWHIAHGAYRRCFTSEDIARLFGSHFEVLEMAEQGGKDGGFWHVRMRKRR
jgi:ubiquinone/menaquinone biosynthesis C-methylase UbiE